MLPASLGACQFAPCTSPDILSLDPHPKPGPNISMGSSPLPSSVTKPHESSQLFLSPDTIADHNLVMKEGFQRSSNMRYSCGLHDLGASLSCRGYWRDIRNVRKELEHWLQVHPLQAPHLLPSQSQLRRTGASSLSSAITKHGGYGKLFSGYMHLPSPCLLLVVLAADQNMANGFCCMCYQSAGMTMLVRQGGILDSHQFKHRKLRRVFDTHASLMYLYEGADRAVRSLVSLGSTCVNTAQHSLVWRLVGGCLASSQGMWQGRDMSLPLRFVVMWPMAFGRFIMYSCIGSYPGEGGCRARPLEVHVLSSQQQVVVCAYEYHCGLHQHTSLPVTSNLQMSFAP